MATPKKVKVFRTTLKHGNTYSIAPYHFQLGRPVDIPERDESIAKHLAKHPSFTVVETYVQVVIDEDVEPVIPKSKSTSADDESMQEDPGDGADDYAGDGRESEEVEDESEATVAEAAKAAGKSVAPRRVPGKK